MLMKCSHVSDQKVLHPLAEKTCSGQEKQGYLKPLSVYVESAFAYQRGTPKVSLSVTRTSTEVLQETLDYQTPRGA